jgi:hypothetical protein
VALFLDYGKRAGELAGTFERLTAGLDNDMENV